MSEIFENSDTEVKTTSSKSVNTEAPRGKWGNKINYSGDRFPKSDLKLFSVIIFKFRSAVFTKRIHVFFQVSVNVSMHSKHKVHLLCVRKLRKIKLTSRKTMLLVIFRTWGSGALLPHVTKVGLQKHTCFFLFLSPVESGIIKELWKIILAKTFFQAQERKQFRSDLENGSQEPFPP